MYLNQKKILKAIELWKCVSRGIEEMIKGNEIIQQALQALNESGVIILNEDEVMQFYNRIDRKIHALEEMLQESIDK